MLIVSLAVAPVQAQQGPKQTTLFDLGQTKPPRIVVTPGDSLPAFDAGGPVMALTLAGVLAELRNPRDIEALRSCVPRNPMLGDAGDADRLCTVHVFTNAKEPAAAKTIAIYRDRAGDFIAVEVGPERPDRVQLNRDAFAALYFGWPNYRGSFDIETLKDPIATVFELPRPYSAGRFIMDKGTLGERLLAGGTTSLEGADRKLEEEKFEVRLPRGYSPRNPAGLLIWVSPVVSGAPPETFWAAADLMNLVCIGAGDAGNRRSAVDRYQLVFDSLATASRRYHIDPRRVYITGMSGGGKVSSILQACFPDVFAGAVPIVGLSCYEQIPSGTGYFYRADYERPKPAIFNLFKTRRMAAMTGRKDFNEVPIQQGVALMQRAGLQVKLYEDTKLGHELPRAEQFTEAMMWVDEPYRKLREAEVTGAKKAMDACRGRFQEKKPDEAGRKVLFKVMEAGPWTPEAWEAAEVLGLTPARSANPR